MAKVPLVRLGCKCLWSATKIVFRRMINEREWLSPLSSQCCRLTNNKNDFKRRNNENDCKRPRCNCFDTIALSYPPKNPSCFTSLSHATHRDPTWHFVRCIAFRQCETTTPIRQQIQLNDCNLNRNSNRTASECGNDEAGKKWCQGERAKKKNKESKFAVSTVTSMPLQH